MAFKHGVCPLCGREIDLPEEADMAYCPECGEHIMVEDAYPHSDLREIMQERAAKEQQAQQPAQPQPQQPAEPAAPQASLSPFAETSPFQHVHDTPFLAQWKTDVLFTILGVAMQLMLAWTLANLSGGQEIAQRLLETGELAYTSQFIISSGLFGLTRAIVAFFAIPRRFRKDYEGRNYLVSFVNGLVGGAIFGPWWNSRLTKRRMGVSHLVFFVLLATDGLSGIIMLLFAA